MRESNKNEPKKESQGRSRLGLQAEIEKLEKQALRNTQSDNWAIARPDNGEERKPKIKGPTHPQR